LLGNRGFSCARQTAEDYQHWHAALCLWLLGNLYDVAFQVPHLEVVRAFVERIGDGQKRHGWI